MAISRYQNSSFFCLVTRLCGVVSVPCNTYHFQRFINILKTIRHVTLWCAIQKCNIIKKKFKKNLSVPVSFVALCKYVSKYMTSFSIRRQKKVFVMNSFKDKEVEHPVCRVVNLNSVVLGRM